MVLTGITNQAVIDVRTKVTITIISAVVMSDVILMAIPPITAVIDPAVINLMSVILCDLMVLALALDILPPIAISHFMNDNVSSLPIIQPLLFVGFVKQLANVTRTPLNQNGYDYDYLTVRDVIFQGALPCYSLLIICYRLSIVIVVIAASFVPQTTLISAQSPLPKHSTTVAICAMIDYFGLHCRLSHCCLSSPVDAIPIYHYVSFF